MRDVAPGPVALTRHGPGAQSVGEAMSRGAGQPHGPCPPGVHPRRRVEHDRGRGAAGRWVEGGGKQRCVRIIK